MSELSPALRAAVLKVLKERVTAAYDEARAEMEADLRGANAGDGTKAREVRLPSGTHIANESLSTPEGSIQVSDSLLLQWVQTRYPDEIETIVPEPETRIRPAFVGKLLKGIVVDEDLNVVVDEATGEIVPWARPAPPGPGRVTMTYTKSGREAVEDAWRAGRLALGDVVRSPALEGTPAAT